MKAVPYVLTNLYRNPDKSDGNYHLNKRETDEYLCVGPVHVFSEMIVERKPNCVQYANIEESEQTDFHQPGASVYQYYTADDEYKKRITGVHNGNTHEESKSS